MTELELLKRILLDQRAKIDELEAERESLIDNIDKPPPAMPVATQELLQEAMVRERILSARALLAERKLAAAKTMLLRTRVKLKDVQEISRAQLEQIRRLA